MTGEEEEEEEEGGLVVLLVEREPNRENFSFFVLCFSILLSAKSGSDKLSSQ